jgi:hypothetical protein
MANLIGNPGFEASASVCDDALPAISALVCSNKTMSQSALESSMLPWKFKEHASHKFESVKPHPKNSGALQLSRWEPHTGRYSLNVPVGYKVELYQDITQELKEYTMYTFSFWYKAQSGKHKITNGGQKGGLQGYSTKYIKDAVVGKGWQLFTKEFQYDHTRGKTEQTCFLNTLIYILKFFEIPSKLKPFD